MGNGDKSAPLIGTYLNGIRVKYVVAKLMIWAGTI